MSKPIETIGVIKETRPDENRTPLIPEHIENIKSNYPNLNVVVQPSKNRCFSDDEYKNRGAEINEDLSKCSIIFGVKEIDTDVLMNNKTYVFFSHTYKLNKETLNNAQGTPGMDKKELLKSVLEKNYYAYQAKRHWEEKQKQKESGVSGFFNKIFCNFCT